MVRLLLILQLIGTTLSPAQTPSDTTHAKPGIIQVDDPSQFFTRFELYNELQHYDNYVGNYYFNQTIFRANVKIGKRFTTRLDIPMVSNSLAASDGSKQSGLGDITFRLLGYRIYERPRTAITASIEISMNTAQSSLLGTGKNVLVPLVSYTRVIPKSRMILVLMFQQANSVSGDPARADINFSKLQFIILKTWSKRTWSLLTPEWYYDYIHNGFSMNISARMTYAPAPRFNIWVTPSTGVFGNFSGRYVWSADVGVRYFILQGMNYKK